MNATPGVTLDLLNDVDDVVTSYFEVMVIRMIRRSVFDNAVDEKLVPGVGEMSWMCVYARAPTYICVCMCVYVFM